MAKSNSIKKLNSFKYETVINVLGIIIVLLFIVNMFFLTSFSSSLKNKINEAEEAARPANIELTVITASCEVSCFDIDSVVTKIKSGNVNVVSEEILNYKNSFPLVSALMNTYGVTKFPTVIVKGELNKTNLGDEFTTVDDALIYNPTTPPYFDRAENKIKGLVIVTILSANDCLNCTDVNLLLNQLKASGVVIKETRTLSESEGRDLVQKYNIKKLPALVLSSDALDYALIKDNWEGLGSKENDGSLVSRELPPPYKNPETGKVEGLVTVTYIVDSSCKTCYDVQLHKQILHGYGVFIAKENTLDVSTPEGNKFAQDNNIKSVPTIVLSNDAKLYTSFYRVFSQVGSEYNGNLIFTSVELMGTYKDLSTGKEVSPEQA